MSFLSDIRLGWVILLSIFAGIRLAHGSGDTPAAMPQGQVCGIYSVYSAARILDVPIKPSTLFKPEYASRSVGSTIDDLCRAAKDIGLTARPLENLSTASLQNAAPPMILHVRGSRSKEYDHWLVFLGMRGNEYLLFDPPLAPTGVSARELNGRWGGVAIAMTKGDAGSVDTPAVGVILYILLGLSVIALVKACQYAITGFEPRPISITTVFSQASWLAMTTTLAAITWHAMSPTGLLAADETSQDLNDAFISDRAPKLSSDDLDRAIRTDDPLLVDARWPEDYSAGHLPNAINIPIDTPPHWLKDILATVEKERQVIIYCESVNCPYSERVAKLLVARGYRNISFFPGGWSEWKSRKNEFPAR